MRLLSLLFTSLLLSVSFADEALEYCPLKEGMEWTMNAKITLPDGTQKKGTARRVIEKAEKRDGKEYYRQRTWMEGEIPAPEQVKLMRRDATGSYSRDPQVKDAEDQAEVLFPLAVGKSWVRVDGETTINQTVMKLENVTIDGVTYEKCYHIQAVSKDGGFTEDYWEAPKVGTVKSITTILNGPKIELTLREFKAGAK